MVKSKSEFSLVFCGKKEEVFTTSEIIAEYAKVSHHSVQQLISSHIQDFEEFGQVAFEMRAVKYSRGTNQKKIYSLNEQQATLLMTYLKNTEPVRWFKKELVRQFYAMREIINGKRIERQGEEWKTARADGKSTRRLETDAIKAFVAYAEESGSGNAWWYYNRFTDLANSAIGIPPKSRERATTKQLLDLRMVETIIDRAIMVEIANGTEYHDAFQNVKEKVSQFSMLALDSGNCVTLSK